MSKASKARIAIVGTGGIAGAHLNGYKTMLDAGFDKFEIAGLCEPYPERRDAFAAKVKEMFGWEPKLFNTAEDLAAGAAAEGIIAADLCTPHAFHHTAAIPCLEAGLDVMVEKPCGITIKASDRILEAARKANRFVAVAEQVRRGIKARAMNWAVNEAHMIGDLRFLSVIGFSARDFAASAGNYATGWRLIKLLTGGGMIFDAGAHFADMMNFLFGEVDTVNAWLGTFQEVMVDSPELGRRPMDVEDSWMSTIRFKSGLTCNWSWSFSAVGEGVAAQVLYGSEGSARDRGGWMHTFQNGADLTMADGSKKTYEEIETEYKAQLSEEDSAKLFPYGVTNDVALECWDFVDSVLNHRKPEIDAETTKLTKSLCLALYESSNAGGATVSVQDVFEGKVSAYQDPVNEYWKI